MSPIKIGLGFLLGVFAVIILLGSTAILIEVGRPKDEDIDFVKFSADFSRRIDEIGPVVAYAEFVKEYSDDKHLPDRHGLAHLVGAKLYQMIGLNGIGVCDRSFFYGCFHSFMEMAIFENGTSSIQILGEHCVDKFGLDALACPHGIGHGILGYVGEKNLPKALDLCDTLKHSYPIGGCPEGVFMEYNFTTAHGTGITTLRKVTAENLYTPCDTTSNISKAACYMDQAQWWMISNLGNQRIAELCAGLPTENLKESCFMGMGRAAPDANEYDKTRTRDACATAGKDRALCRAGALITFLASTPEDQTDFFCGDLNPEEKTVCLEKVEFLRPVTR